MARNVLHKKLLRDMRRSGMQFIALVLLCVLGTFLYAGIDGISRMTQTTNERYFEENKLADFWVTLPAANRQALSDIRGIPGVEAACARFSLDMETTLPDEPTLNVTAYDGPMTVNIPIIEEGEVLQGNDDRGCLMQAGFAEANNLGVGSKVVVRLNDQDYELTVRGIIYSPEFISVTDDFAANPLEYGYVLVNAGAFSQIPLTQVVVRLSPGADQSAVRRAIMDKQPLAFVLDHKSHRSTAVARDNVTMFHALSIVFPMAAFAVAAMIVMTTLTRMIDNQRMQIGTFRALGYSNRVIQGHYLCYAVFPSLLGSVLGTLIGHMTLPMLVWELLIGQNEYPYRLQPPVSLPAWCMTGVSVAMGIGICLFTYRKAARETTADLLRPKPPKAGKRVFLEYITPLWSRLGFNSKMVVRNLMRSKSRTLMSCVGLMCCSGLLIASLGLQDSVTSTVTDHYGGTLRYDLRVKLNDKAGAGEGYESRLPAERVECLMERMVNITAGDQNRTNLLTVLDNDQQLMRLGKNETWVALPEGQLAVTDILADILKVKPGDALTLMLPGEDERILMTVGSIVYNNFSQGVYMNRSTWDSLRKGGFTPTAIQILGPTEACLTRLGTMDEVSKIDTIQQQTAEAMVSFNMVSSIFVLLMFIALAMAFVICYNMGLINFAERTREYATLKVLGYHQREIRRLILKENVVVALIAIVLAVVPGLALTGMILRVCETDSIRYVSQVTPAAVALSSVVTFVLSIMIQLLLMVKVRSIVMVEALKSVE